MDLSLVDMTLCDSPDQIHVIKIWAVQRSQVERKKWHIKICHFFRSCLRSSSSSKVRGMPVHCPTGTQSVTRHSAYCWQQFLSHKLITICSVYFCARFNKKNNSVQPSFGCFITTMKLPHALRIYAVSVEKCMW